MSDSAPVLSMSSVTKNYGALRPLRLERLELPRGHHVALVGLDQPAAEVFINLVTGAGLPDTGTVAVNGETTAAIVSSDDWLGTLDRFGIVSDRAPLLESLSVVQNLSLSFTLDIEPPPDDVRAKAEQLARLVGLPVEVDDQRAQQLSAADQLRLRLARALALDPMLVILEHPSASLPREAVAPLARHVRALLEQRGVTAVTLTMDKELADAIAPRTLTLDPVTGKLKEGWLARMGFR